MASMTNQTANPGPHPLIASALEASGMAHGFFTREGGISTGLYAGLNCGPGSDDDPKAVGENRARAAHALGARPETLVTAYQVHSPDVVRVVTPWLPGAAPRADGMVTDQPGLVLGVLTADCAPVLFADGDAGIIGAAHAGWKGALGGVLEATVQAMVGLGADPAGIVAAVGPTIAQPSYEVGAEFRDRFTVEAADNDRFFVPSARADHYQFDLPGYVSERLGMLGLGVVEVLDRDTRTEDGLFFSYRRSTLAGERDYGRQLSAITLTNGSA